MLYELRHYDVEGEQGLRFVVDRFGQHVLPAFDRAGIEPVGFWTVFVGPHSPRLSYLLPWQDLAQRQKAWGAFEADSLWRAARNETNTQFGGSPIRTITNAILQPVPNSPLPRKDTQPLRLAGGAFELRTLTFIDYEKMAQGMRWLSEQAVPLMEKHGMHLMGLWLTYIGVSPRVTYILVFENLADRERSWAACHTDPSWQTIEDNAYSSRSPWILSEESCLMRGTAFSGWR